MSERRGLPKLDFTAVSWGLLIALLVGLALFSVATATGATILGIAASMISCGVGGFLAGKRAKRDGLYHGAVVGAAWVAFEAFGLVPTAVGSGSSTVEETISIILSDLVILAAAAAGGWAATRT